MKSWVEFIKTKEYQSADAIKKIMMSTKYRDDVVKSNKYKSLSTIEQTNVKRFLEKETLRETLTEAFRNPIANKPLIKGLQWGNKMVEKLAAKIEPEVDPYKSKTMALLTEFTRFLAAEVTRLHKPGYLIAATMAGKAIKPIAKPIGKMAGKVIPQKLKDIFLKQFTIGKGRPPAYQAIAEKTELARMAGGREAEQVGRVLSTKAGKPLTRVEQKYVGRIFRKEVDLGGKKSAITFGVEKGKRIMKNIEVEVAFNPKVQAIQKRLVAINKMLRGQQGRANAAVGKVFRTKAGNIEKVVGVKEVKHVGRGGRYLKPTYDLITEPIVPKTGQIPAQMFPDEDVIRNMAQVGKATTIEAAPALTRKQLLQRQKIVSRELAKEIEQIEQGVRANYDIFDRTYTEQIRTHPKFKELSAIANEGRDIADKWSKELIKSGIPREQAKEAIEGNIGKYMARMYETKLPKTGQGFSFKALRSRLDGLRHRKNLNHETLIRLGEIKEPALPTAMRVKEISASVANNKLFNQVAKNPEWVSSVEKAGMVKLANTKALGALKNKWIIKPIADDINGMLTAQLQSQGFYIKSLQAWKYGKVVLNPATHIRNMISNTMLLDLSGVNHLRQAQLMPRVFKDYLTKGRTYQLALKHGAIGGEFYGGEIAKIKDSYMAAGGGGNINRWLNVAKKPFKAAGNVYQAEEQISKLVKFTDMLSKKATPEIAAKEAQKWLFNYNKIPKFIELARTAPIGAPFITFTYKALPRIAEAIVNNPLKVYKYFALFKGWNNASRKFLKMSPEDYAREQKALPPWQMKAMGGMPSTLLMPWKDKYNRTQWLNLEYILPVGMAPEIMQKGLIKGGVSNPLFTIYAAISKNEDFKGQDIVPVGATKTEGIKIITEYIYRQVAPSLAPSLGDIKGGYSFEKLMDAARKKPDYAERIRSVPQVILDVLAGLKITPVDVDEAEMFKMYDKQKMLLDLQKQIRRLDHPGISEKVRDKGIESIFKKMEKVLED